MTKTNWNFQQYATSGEFLTACNSPALENGGWTDATRESRKGSEAFTGTKTYDEAVKLAQEGWPKGLQQITKRLSRIQEMGTGLKWQKAIAGSHPDVARFIAGMPDNMNKRIVSDCMRKPCYDIVVNASYSCDITTKQIMNYGAAIANAIDTLEGLGYSISLKLAHAARNDDKAWGECIVMKSHGEALDLDRMAFYVAHPSFLRRLVFSHNEAFNTQATISYGYGSPCGLPEEHMLGDTIMYFPHQRSLDDCDTLTGALDHVFHLIKSQHPDLIEDHILEHIKDQAA